MGWEFAADPGGDCADGEAGRSAGDSGGGGWSARRLAQRPKISKGRESQIAVRAADGIGQEEGPADCGAD